MCVASDISLVGSDRLVYLLCLSSTVARWDQCSSTTHVITVKSGNEKDVNFLLRYYTNPGALLFWTERVPWKVRWGPSACAAVATGGVERGPGENWDVCRRLGAHIEPG